MDEAFKEKEEIITEQNIVISLRESEYEGEKKYVGAFEYNDNYYYCVSSINYAEMKKILKYLIVFWWIALFSGNYFVYIIKISE